LSDDEKTSLEELLKEVSAIMKSSWFSLEAMDSDAAPFLITQPEFMRRMKEMQATGWWWYVWYGQYARNV
jgi:molecular chaperone HtpG